VKTSCKAESTASSWVVGDEVAMTGFLSLERVERAARTGRNPRTGESIDIPAGFGVKASPGSGLKQAVQS